MADFGFDTTVDEVAAAYAEQIRGKNILITGCSPGGLGAELARGILRYDPGLVVIAGRNIDLLQKAEREFKYLEPSLRTRTLEIDLLSQESVRKAAAEVNAYEESIDVLINSAGVSFGGYKLSIEGIERAFAINHVGHFLFTNLILPKILSAGPGARIVSLSSGGHRFGPVRFDDLNFQNGAAYDPLEAYGQSKTANILFIVRMAKLLKAKGVLCYSLHPGSIYTNFLRDISIEKSAELGWTDSEGRPIDKTMKWKTLPQGAATTAVAAFDPSITDQSGSYLADCQVANDRALEYALNEENALRLWRLSETLVNQTFDI